MATATTAPAVTTATAIDPDKRYPTGQAAKLLGVTRTTLIGRINAGLIKATRLPAAGNGTPHRRVLGFELLRALGEAGQTAAAARPPAPKKRTNRAERDRLNARKRLGLD